MCVGGRSVGVCVPRAGKTKYPSLLHVLQDGREAAFMFLAVLAAGFLLQCLCVATGGQRSSKPQVFYAVEMKGGATSARVLAQQHGLQFISQVRCTFRSFFNIHGPSLSCFLIVLSSLSVLLYYALNKCS